MKREITGVVIAATLLLVGCGKQAGGTLEITENGTYDVANYSQVVVKAGEEPATEAESTAEASAVAVQDLNLVRVQFKDFSMEVPSAMVEGYTEAELTENDYITRSITREGSPYLEMVSISGFDTLGSGTLEDFCDYPQEDAGGITMGVRHEHSGDSRTINVKFMSGDKLYTVNLSYPVALDDLYADYSENFYRTIQLS